MTTRITKTIMYFISVAIINYSISVSAVQVLINDQSGQETWLRLEQNGSFVGPAIEVSTLPDTTYNSGKYKLYNNSEISANTFSAGRIYFSYGEGMPGSDPTGDPSNLDVASLRYDWVELTADGSSTACANLTAVNLLGIPMTLTSYLDNSVVTTVGYNGTFQNIINALQTANPLAYIPQTDGAYVRIVSPDNEGDSIAQTWSAINNYSSYFAFLKGERFEIKGNYFGSSSQKYAACTYDYTGIFPNSSADSLVLNSSSTSGIQGNITIVPNTALDSNLYQKLNRMINACDGTFTVENPSQGGTTQTVGSNTAYSAVIRDLVTGYNLGFFGYTGANGTNYNISSNWYPLAAFQNASGGSYPYGNVYAYILNQYTNSYAFPFQDYLGNVYSTLAPNKADTLVINILSDAASGTGYVPKSSNNPNGKYKISLGIPAGDFPFDSLGAPIINGVIMDNKYSSNYGTNSPTVYITFSKLPQDIKHTITYNFVTGATTNLNHIPGAQFANKGVIWFNFPANPSWQN